MNKLKDALSPYLLQHKNNPVDWNEWGEEAFAEAKKRNVPLFLSIGYSACHWCHVMAHESFEDQTTADYLNKHFVCIKVDREERPDIDDLYMQAVTYFSEQGGWPLNMFLTPDGKPFFGGTYFPKEAAYGRISFIDLLKKVSASWKDNQVEITENVKSLQLQLNKKIISSDKKEIPNLNVINKQHQSVKQYIDFQNGGLKGAQKFPQVPLWSWIFTLGMTSDDQELIDACYLTANKICNGGIYDHLVGGWARYSTDTNWLVPHFEKMLYDNAQLIEWLTALYAYKPNPLFYERIAQTIAWLKKEMLLSEGVFAAAIDADSEGEEGKYYIWHWDELKEILGDKLENFAAYYGFNQAGNWEGKIILHRNHENDTKIPPEEIKRLNEKLLLERNKRIKPHRDDKALLSWNALLIKALTKASVIFNKPAWLALAKTTYQSLLLTLRKDKAWQHCYRAGKYQKQRLLDDYAFIISAALSLYCATGDNKYIDNAEDWFAEVNSQFLDKENNLYSQCSNEGEQLIADIQTLTDGTMPNGNGTMALNAIQLYLLTGKKIYLDRWQTLIGSLSEILDSEHAWQLASISQALAYFHQGIKIEADWLKQFSGFVERLEGQIKPLFLLVQNSKSSEINLCNYTSCFEQFSKLDEFKAWLEISSRPSV